MSTIATPLTRKTTPEGVTVVGTGMKDRARLSPDTQEQSTSRSTSHDQPNLAVDDAKQTLHLRRKDPDALRALHHRGRRRCKPVSAPAKMTTFAAATVLHPHHGGCRSPTDQTSTNTHRSTAHQHPLHRPRITTEPYRPQQNKVAAAARSDQGALQGQHL
jgi:hypothetical protein